MIQEDGVIVVDKEPGPSSSMIVEQVKHLLKVGKAGHAGTLDPFASGILVVLLNQGTKLSPFLMSQDKVYKAGLRLGVETDTQDLTGRITEEQPIGSITEEDIEQATQRFVGTTRQIPPPYSAVHHNGKRAYELARRGLMVRLRERDVRIDYVNILSVDLPTVWIEIGCSSGTYIRALAATLGRSLGTGAHLTYLRRIKSGPFVFDHAVTLAEIAQHLSRGTLGQIIISLRDALKDMVEVEVQPGLARKIRSGYRPVRYELWREDIPSLGSGMQLKVVAGDELVAVLRKEFNGYDIERVFL
jgi:tRNA pseudouridine55 synthase